jgi:hypothetical protein
MATALADCVAIDPRPRFALAVEADVRSDRLFALSAAVANVAEAAAADAAAAAADAAASDTASLARANPDD